MNSVIFSPPSCRSSLYEGRVGGVCGSSSVSSQQQLPASARGRSAPVAVYTQSWCWPPAATTHTTDTASSADSGSWSLSCDHLWPHQHQWLSDTPPQLLWVLVRGGAGQSDQSYPASSRSIVARCSEVLVLSISWNIYLVMAPWIWVAILLFQLNNAVLNNIKL